MPTIVVIIVLCYLKSSKTPNGCNFFLITTFWGDARLEIASDDGEKSTDSGIIQDTHRLRMNFAFVVASLLLNTSILTGELP